MLKHLCFPSFPLESSYGVTASSSASRAGSGKTCGFLLPGMLHINATRKDARAGPTVLVLAPTRELAVQIKEEADKFGRSSGIKNTCALVCR